MLIIQAMGLERKLKAYKVLLPMSMDSEIQSEFWSFFSYFCYYGYLCYIFIVIAEEFYMTSVF